MYSFCTCASLCRTKCGSTFGGWVEALKEGSVTVALLEQDRLGLEQMCLFFAWQQKDRSKMLDRSTLMDFLSFRRGGGKGWLGYHVNKSNEEQKIKGSGWHQLSSFYITVMLFSLIIPTLPPLSIHQFCLPSVMRVSYEYLSLNYIHSLTKSLPQRRYNQPNVPGSSGELLVLRVL